MKLRVSGCGLLVFGFVLAVITGRSQQYHTALMVATTCVFVAILTIVFIDHYRKGGSFR
jgi:hypothetical protein